MPSRPVIGECRLSLGYDMLASRVLVSYIGDPITSVQNDWSAEGDVPFRTEQEILHSRRKGRAHEWFNNNKFDGLIKTHGMRHELKKLKTRNG